MGSRKTGVNFSQSVLFKKGSKVEPRSLYSFVLARKKCKGDGCKGFTFIGEKRYGKGN